MSNETISTETAELDLAVRLARQAGDISALLHIARDAIDRLEALADTQALQAARRIGYNAAADAWPGWELPAPPRSAAELAAGQELARRCASLTERLDEDALKRGNAAWLVAAFDLARGDAASLAGFREAAELFEGLPVMKLMAEGYAAIAAERFAPDFTAVIAGLEAIGGEDATGMRDQLLVARQVFCPKKNPDGL